LQKSRNWNQKDLNVPKNYVILWLKSSLFSAFAPKKLSRKNPKKTKQFYTKKGKETRKLKE